MDDRPVEHVPGFPACRLLALIDTDAELHGALDALEPYVEPAAIRLLSGRSGADALDVSGAARGLRGRMVRAVQDLAYGRGALYLHEAHLRSGGHLLLIPARTWTQCRQFVEVLSEWGAHGLLWFARFSVVDVTPRYCVVTGHALTVG